MFKAQSSEDEVLIESIHKLHEAIEAREDCDPEFEGTLEQLVLDEEQAREEYEYQCEQAGLDPEVMYDEVIYHS